MVTSSWPEQIALLGCGLLVLIAAKVLFIICILIALEVFT